MLIAALSDIHDRVGNLARVLEALAAHSPGILLCCGDITTPETLEVLAGFEAPVHFCLGNCDQAGAAALLKFARSRLSLKGSAKIMGSLKIPGGEVAFTHFPETARQAASSGKFKAVFYGHTHQARVEWVEKDGNPCLLANPGDIQGRFGQAPGALLWDSGTQALRWIKG